MIALEQLSKCVPACPGTLLSACYAYLAQAFEEFEINTPARQAAALAQMAWESNSFRDMTERSDGKCYEGRRDLGNTYPGDGPRFIGRGVIQLTGRANYAAASKALGVNLEDNPEQASSLPVAFRSAGWYWKAHGLNELADQGTPDAFDRITRRINGGLNGKAGRDANWIRCKAVLG